MCKHYIKTGVCSLQQYCQYAHGYKELRQPKDPLPDNFGKTASGAVHPRYVGKAILGGVHSNYKT